MNFPGTNFPIDPPRTDDPGALVESARLHHTAPDDLRYARACVVCYEAMPCLTIRLADALEHERQQKEMRHAAWLEVQGQRDRLALEALSALSGAHIGTPVEGYVEAPYCLKGDIEDLARQRDAARAEAAALRERAERLQELLVKGQRDRHGDFHPLVPFEECKRGDCCAVLVALAPQEPRRAGPEEA